MSKEISVKTSSGTKLYKVSGNGGTFYFMKYVDSFFGSWEDIGKARSLEDILSVIKSHAAKYGSVYSVNIN
jgi:hypothetical protein